MRVKVWNDNVHDIKEKFKGDDIFIKAKGFIEMELFEANDYRGQYYPMILGSDGTQDPKSFKMIRIERITDSGEIEAPALHVCQACAKKYESAPVLKAHIDTEHADAARLEIPDVDETIKKRTKKAG